MAFTRASDRERGAHNGAASSGRSGSVPVERDSIGAGRRRDCALRLRTAPAPIEHQSARTLDHRSLPSNSANAPCATCRLIARALHARLANRTEQLEHNAANRTEYVNCEQRLSASALNCIYRYSGAHREARRRRGASGAHRSGSGSTALNKQSGAHNDTTRREHIVPSQSIARRRRPLNARTFPRAVRVRARVHFTSDRVHYIRHRLSFQSEFIDRSTLCRALIVASARRALCVRYWEEVRLERRTTRTRRDAARRDETRHREIVARSHSVSQSI